jgi:hypothetical protein
MPRLDPHNPTKQFWTTTPSAAVQVPPETWLSAAA